MCWSAPQPTAGCQQAHRYSQQGEQRAGDVVHFLRPALFRDQPSVDYRLPLTAGELGANGERLGGNCRQTEKTL